MDFLYFFLKEIYLFVFGFAQPTGAFRRGVSFPYP